MKRSFGVLGMLLMLMLSTSTMATTLDEEVVQNLQTIKTRGEVLGNIPGNLARVGDSNTHWHVVGKIATDGLTENDTGTNYGYGFNQLSNHEQVPGSFLDWINVNNFNTDGWGPPSCAYGSEPDGTWCYGLGECCGAVPGDTVGRHIARGYPQLVVDNMKPSWCTIMLGTNDIVSAGVTSWGTGFHIWGDTYKDYVQGYIDLGVIPVLITIPPRYTYVDAYFSPNGVGEVRFDYADSMNAQIKRVSEELAVPLIDLNAAIKFAQPDDPVQLPDGTWESGKAGCWFGNFVHGWNHPYGTGIHLDSKTTTSFTDETLYSPTSKSAYALLNKLIFDTGIAIKEQVFDVESPQVVEPPYTGGMTIGGLELPEVEHVIEVENNIDLFAAFAGLEDNTRIIMKAGAYTTDNGLLVQGKYNIQLVGDLESPSVIVGGQSFGFYSGNEDATFLRINSSDTVYVVNVIFAWCHGYGIKVDGESSPKNITIWNCEFYNIAMRMIKGSAATDASTRADTGVIRYCHFENNASLLPSWRDGGNYVAAIDMMTLKDWEISDNTFKNVKGLSGGGRAAIFVWNSSENVRAERNLIDGCDRGIAYGNPSGAEAHMTGGEIYNNIIYCGPDAAIELTRVNDVKVFHNTIIRESPVLGTRGIRCIAPVSEVYLVNNDNGANTELCYGAHTTNDCSNSVWRTEEVLDNFDGEMRERITNIGAY